MMQNSKPQILQEIIVSLKSLVTEMKGSNLNIRITPGLIASLGELIVLYEILQKDNKAELMSGHKKADIKLGDGRKIEVKTTNKFNDEKKHKYWGFGSIRPENFVLY